MANGWLDANKYEHIQNTAATGPGTYFEGYSWKWVNHSTEGPPGSIAGTIALFKAQPASCPHFMIDPMGTRRRVQFIPWTWSAAALRGGSNGWQTNRGRAVQVEICGYARDSGDWPDDALWIIADTIADVIKDGCPIDATNTPDSSKLRGTLATMNAAQRMSWPTWQRFPGIAAHVYVPNNDHWDVGTLNNVRVGRLVQEILGGAAARIVTPGTDISTPAPADVNVAYITIGMTGGQVTLIQELLEGLGYEVGELDGVFGPATEGAVCRFQEANGLDVDGIVGPITKAKLAQLYAEVSGKTPPPTPSASSPRWPGRFFVLTSPMMSGEDIRTWQTQMDTRGWRITADAWYGVESYGVCKTFQAEKGLVADGICGPQTWDAAWSAPVT